MFNNYYVNTACNNGSIDISHSCIVHGSYILNNCDHPSIRLIRNVMSRNYAIIDEFNVSCVNVQMVRDHLSCLKVCKATGYDMIPRNF